MSPQERFEIVYADVTGEAVESLPQFRCKAIDSYLDPKMSRAYLFFKAADERAELARALLQRALDDLNGRGLSFEESKTQDMLEADLRAFLGAAQ